MDVARILNIMIRLCGTGALLLGVAFWLGFARGLTQLHMGLGIGLVISLWALAWIVWRSTKRNSLVAFAAIWGGVSWLLGIAQSQILPGSLHWVVQVTHLVVGGTTIAIGNLLVSAVQARGLARAPGLSG